jgi:hypothetical protein
LGDKKHGAAPAFGVAPLAGLPPDWVLPLGDG